MNTHEAQVTHWMHVWLWKLLVEELAAKGLLNPWDMHERQSLFGQGVAGAELEGLNMARDAIRALAQNHRP